MSSFNQSECLGCGQLCDGLYCYPCTCQQCGVVLINGICFHCIYGDGKPITCCECEGPLRGGFSLFCNLKAENSFTYDPNAYSFNDTSSNFNHLPQPQYETYLCELCGNDSHYGYDCPTQFPFVYEQEPSYNQNYNDNYYPHNSPNFLCCDNCRGSHETFHCQPMDQNINSSGFDQIQPPQYPVIHHPSQEMKTESDKVIKSSVKNIVEVTSDNESECDVPVKDESSPIFKTFSNPTFDYNDDFTSSDDELLSKEDVSMENFKIYSNPLFDDEEVNSNKIDPHYFNAESDLIESLSNRDILFDSSPKFDYLEEFSGELMPTSIINEESIKREHEEYISLMEKLLTINSFPRPLENFHANTIIKTLPASPIPVEDSDSLMEEIDIFTGTDDFMTPGIESDDYDSKGDNHFLEELLSNDSISLPENESSNFDYHDDDASFPRPPPEPQDVKIFFEPDLGVLTTNVVNGSSEHYVLMPDILPTLPTFDPLCPVYDTLLLFSSENKDIVFKPGILSYLLVSHQDKTTFDFFENPMMMYGEDIPLKVVPDLRTIPIDK
uniref:Pre-mRNA splicing Prp18-interacting factor n=1 Tax=Tanacetum cinerariifolium TaxID=118510 RepID=A0A6L2LZA4_TANCI|nr:hypothetical protein [Tanacetum cinerariifolium]